MVLHLVCTMALLRTGLCAPSAASPSRELSWPEHSLPLTRSLFVFVRATVAAFCKRGVARSCARQLHCSRLIELGLLSLLGLHHTHEAWQQSGEMASINA